MSNWFDQPVFICGHRKGGTTLLVCLLDNHPELLTYPVDSGFFYEVYPYLFTETRAESMRRLEFRCIEDCLSNEMKKVKSPDLFDIEAIKSAFRENMGEYTELKPKYYLKSLMKAYSDNCGQESGAWKYWVEKTTTTEVFATEIAEWFPNAKFIHLVRDPRDNWGSLLSGWEKRYQHQEENRFDLLKSLIFRVGAGFTASKYNQSVLGQERYLKIRYEDLVTDWDQTSRKITTFLGIDYDPIMAVPTVNGVVWPGNNFEGKTFSAIDASSVSSWQERTDRKDVAVIEAVLGSLMEDEGYSLATTADERSKALIRYYSNVNFGIERNL